MVHLLRRISNILWCSLYSFRITYFSNKPTITEPGDTIRINGAIKNNGLRIGTVYCIIKLADAYDHTHIMVNTDQDFEENQKQALRITDIPVQGTREFCCDIVLPQQLKPGVLDISIELWTPRRLFRRTSRRYDPFLFHKTNWRGSVEVVMPQRKICRAFISYSWFSQQHSDWVRQLSEVLIRHQIETVLDQNDMVPGNEIIAFMERSTTEHPICIAICSASYTKKANEGLGCVGYEVSLLAKDILTGQRKFAIIPVIRDNPSKSIPDCFGSRMSVDMDTEAWQAAPLSQLISAIHWQVQQLTIEKTGHEHNQQ